VQHLRRGQSAQHYILATAERIVGSSIRLWPARTLLWQVPHCNIGGVMAQAICPGWAGLARLSAMELAIVHCFVLTARPPVMRSLAIALSWLGNGWAYAVIALSSIATVGLRALPAIIIGALNAGVLHCLYPSIKRRVARPRPYQRDESLRPLLRALDEYSFPSGHAMTMTAALTPLVLMLPATIIVVVSVWLLLAWARLASAHHYPSDVIVGATLGASVAYPLSVGALAASHLMY